MDRTWFALVLGAMILGINSGAEANTSGTEVVRVALFADPGSTQESSREAMFKLLSGRDDVTVDKVTTETVQAAGFLDNYDVFVLPGGTGGGEAKAVGVEAGKEIARRVKAGKGLVAVCAGGYYVAQGWNPATEALDIINADNHDGEHWARGDGFIAVKVLGVADGESSRTMWFENGPIFKPAGMEGLVEYVPLVKYVSDLAAKDAPKEQMTGRDAVIAAPYGEGRVVAFGPHPELSPGANHWLINSIKWAAKKGGAGDKDNDAITANRVLEGRPE